MATVIEFVIGIILLIIVHELGHFIACRLLKVDVEEFGLGFPPRAAVLFESRGTKFTLNWLPFGGFVRPKGQDDPSVEGGLAAANPWVRIGVLLSGSLMNIAFAVLLFAWISWMVGKPDPAREKIVEITSVASLSPAESAGLLPGDIIVSIDDQVTDSTDRVHELIYARLGQPMDLTYQRDDQIQTVVLIPRDPPPQEGAIGISMAQPRIPIGPLEALPNGLKSVYGYTVNMVNMIGRLITGQVSSDQGRVVGFKGMYDVYSNVRQETPILGIPKLAEALSFFASLSVWLGLINLAPIPALDGGRIVFVLPEIIIRRRVPAQFEAVLNGIVFILLIALMVWINLRDFIYPVQIP